MQNYFKEDVKTPLIIAETAFSHEGSVSYLKELVSNIAGESNIAIKFQVLINKEDYLTNTNAIYEEIDNWLLSEEEWLEVIDFCEKQNVEIILAVLDDKALELANKVKSKILALEVHPSSIPDKAFLNNVINFCNSNNKPLLIGVSGFEAEEISYLYANVLDNVEQKMLMYGFQNYPTDLSTINLSKAQKYKEKFNLNVGYADHTEFSNPLKDKLLYTAFGMGHNILEIHYVLEMGKERLDYITAYDSQRIISLRNDLITLSSTIGTGTSKLSAAEREYGVGFRKIPVYNKDLIMGQVLTSNDIDFKRSHVPSEYLIFESDKLIGKKLTKSVKKDSPILKEELD